MQFWWVNQNQTYEQEIAGGYMWSPKTNSNGGRNQFYDNMKSTEPGDVVFSFRKQSIAQFGIVIDRAISAPKPEEFGEAGSYWANEGWLVAVKWSPLQPAIYPRNIFNEIKPYLPEKYSPLQKDTGKGLQGVYLANVPEQMAAVIVRHAKDVSILSLSADALSGFEHGLSIELFEEKIMESIEQNTDIEETEKVELRRSRRGQGRFRKNVEKIEKGCRITGVSDRRLLIASHIKPWRACENNHERLDGNNGFLLTPTFDLLFDKGYMTFDEDGKVVFSDSIDRQELIRCNFPLDDKFSVGTLNEHQQRYLDYHRNSVFLR